MEDQADSPSVEISSLTMSYHLSLACGKQWVLDTCRIAGALGRFSMDSHEGLL